MPPPKRTRITAATQNGDQTKRYTTSMGVHKLIHIITYIVLLVICIKGDDTHRHHRPRPWPPMNKYPLPGQMPTNDTSNTLLINFTMTGPGREVLNVSTESTTGTQEQPTVDIIDADRPDDVDCPDCLDHANDETNDGNNCPNCDQDIGDDDENKQNYPNDNCPDCDQDDDDVHDNPIDDENYPNDSGPEYTEPQKTDEEKLNEMISSLDPLLNNASAVVTIGNVSSAFDKMDVLLATEDESFEFPSAVLTALDTLSARADLNGSAAVASSWANVAVAMADSTPERPVRGVKITSGAGDSGLSDEDLEILQDSMDPSTLTSDTNAVVNLPSSLTGSPRRISFVVFRSDRAFVRHNREQYVVNSRVISVHVENFTQMADGETIDIYLKPSTYEPARNMTRACAYWHFAENNTGYWSQEGCSFIKSPTGMLDICRCTHLTHFAEILIPKVVFSEENETALAVTSLVGCFLSLFGLLIIGLTAILFRSWRKDFNNKIWLQLTIALLINDVSFLVIVFSSFDDYTIVCVVVGIILHYAVLASFCWMLVAAIISYRKLVVVFARNPRRRLLKASAFSWLFPVAVVTTLVSINPQSYSTRFERHTPAGGFCYPSGLGLWLSVFLPIAIVVLSNWVIFVLILRSVFRTKKVQKHGDSSEMLRRASVCCLLVFLLGLPWIFGLFASNIVVAYLFTLTASYQGFVLFIFFIILNTKTRGMWLNKLHIKKTKDHVSSSLITNKKSPISNEAEQHIPFIEPSSTRTNVTSLVSNLSDGNVIAYNVTSDSAIIEDSYYNSKDSDIDSFITAKSHDNFTEDEIFKSIEGITDVIEHQDSNIQIAEFLPIRTNSRDSVQFKKMLAKSKVDTGPEVVGYILKTDNGVSSGFSAAKIKNDEDISIKDDVSDKSSRKSENSDGPVDPEINVYNVPTRNASLIN